MKFIPLTQGEFAIVDDEDFEAVSGMKFHVVKIGKQKYARSRGVYLHHMIHGKPAPGNHVDHRDGDGLNNRRKNLREIRHAMNLKNGSMSRRNTSGYRGVSFDRARGKWIVVTSINGKVLTLGRFKTPVAAAMAFDRFTIQHFGTDVSLNFPDLT